MMMMVMLGVAACCCSCVGGLGVAYSQDWLCECCDLCKDPKTTTGPPSGTDDVIVPDTEDDDAPDTSSSGKKNTSYDLMKSKISGNQNVYIQSYKCRNTGQCLGAWKLFGEFPNKVKIRMAEYSSTRTEKPVIPFGQHIDTLYGYIITAPRDSIQEKKLFTLKSGKKKLMVDTVKYREWKVEKGDGNTVHFKNKDGKYLAIGKTSCTLESVYLYDKKALNNRWTILGEQIQQCTATS